MIIVSQGKREIINFDNINLIGTDGEGAIRARLGVEDNVHLGAYATEERAKEVLKEITIIYADKNEYIDNSNGAAIYEMPEN